MRHNEAVGRESRSAVFVKREPLLTYTLFREIAVCVRLMIRAPEFYAIYRRAPDWTAGHRVFVG